MANVRYISNGTKNINIGGYIFKQGIYYVLSEALAATIDQIKIGKESVFSSLERTPSHGVVNLSNRGLNSDGKIVLQAGVTPSPLIAHITKPDTTAPTSQEALDAVAAQLDESGDEDIHQPHIKLATDPLKQPSLYIDLPRADLDAEAKKRDLKVRANMRTETVIGMLVENDAEQAETATEAQSKTIIQF